MAVVPLLVSLLLIFFSSASFCSDSADTSLKVQKIWSWSAPEGLYSTFLDCVHFQSGILVLGVAQDAATKSTLLTTTYFDTTGMVIWERRYDDLPYLWSPHIFNSGEGCLIFGITEIDKRSGRDTPCFAAILIDDWGRITEFRPLPSVGLGRIVDAWNVSSTWNLLFSSDKKGSPLSTQLVQLGDTISKVAIDDRYVVDAIRTQNDRFRAVGFRPDTGSTYTPIYMEVDSRGTVLSELTIDMDTLHYFRPEPGISWELFNWGGYCVAMNCHNFDSNGNARWTHYLLYFGYGMHVEDVILLEPSSWYRNHVLIDVVLLNQSTLLSAQSNMRGSATILLHDAAGTKAWEEQFGEQYGRPFKLIEGMNDCFYVIGKSWSKGDPDDKSPRYDHVGMPLIHEAPIDPVHSNVHARIEAYKVMR